MSHRALLTISALTLADYFLWHWSLDSNRDVLALVSGLTLPPLAVAFLWLLALSLARLLARGARRPAALLRLHGGRAARSLMSASGTRRSHTPRPRTRRARGASSPTSKRRAAHGADQETSRKLAA